MGPSSVQSNIIKSVSCWRRAMSLQYLFLRKGGWLVFYAPVSPTVTVSGSSEGAGALSLTRLCTYMS